MSALPEISQRDLQTRSAEIVDAVSRGQAFSVIRDGRPIGELIPLHRPRRFVPRREFAAMARPAATVDPGAFRTDQDTVSDGSLGSVSC